MTQNKDNPGIPKVIQDPNNPPKTQESNLLATGNIFGAGTEEIEKITRYAGRGGQQSALAANYYGFNHRNIGSPLPKNTDSFGYTFFTRPRLRLSYDNLISDRTFALLNSKDKHSVHRWVRATLDPMQRETNMDLSPLVDPQQAFIPILSNSLLSLSGWPEVTVDTYTSPEGLRREQWSMADGFSKYHSQYSLSAEFKNTINNPVTELFYYWTQYQLMVHEGLMHPHLECSVENEIDYQTRIYRLTMDSSRQFITDIAATGVAFPLSSNVAAKFDFSRESIYNDNNDTVSIPFQCIGAIYKDPILMVEFNLTVQTFNMHMHDSLRGKLFYLLKPNEVNLFNHFGYPRIDLDTGRLEWWVYKTEYDAIMKSQGYSK